MCPQHKQSTDNGIRCTLESRAWQGLGVGDQSQQRTLEAKKGAHGLEAGVGGGRGRGDILSLTYKITHKIWLRRTNSTFASWHYEDLKVI